MKNLDFEYSDIKLNNYTMDQGVHNQVMDYSEVQLYTASPPHNEGTS